MDEKECHECERDDHMHEIYNSQAAEHADYRTEPLHVKQQDSGDNLYRHEEDYNEEIGGLLKRIELVVRRAVVRIRIPSEHAVSVIHGLGKTAGKVFFQIQRRELERYPAGECIIAEPHDISQYQDTPNMGL
jgi:hypothetical protein